MRLRRRILDALQDIEVVAAMALPYVQRIHEDLRFKSEHYSNLQDLAFGPDGMQDDIKKLREGIANAIGCPSDGDVLQKLRDFAGRAARHEKCEYRKSSEENWRRYQVTQDEKNELEKVVRKLEENVKRLNEDLLGCSHGKSRKAPCRPCGRVKCMKCGVFVEKQRLVYALPTCYGCLPPPPALLTQTDVGEVLAAQNTHHDQAMATLRDQYAKLDKMCAGIMRDFQIESDESVRDIVERTTAAAIKNAEQVSILRQREPTRAEMEKALYESKKDEAFLNGTIRRCRHCKAPVFGGTTACTGCVNGHDRAELQRTIADLQKSSGPYYSGSRSDWFWNRVNSLRHKEKGELYCCGVLLQEMEKRVLGWLISAEPKEQTADAG